MYTDETAVDGSECKVKSRMYQPFSIPHVCLQDSTIYMIPSEIFHVLPHSSFQRAKASSRWACPEGLVKGLRAVLALDWSLLYPSQVSCSMSSRYLIGSILFMNLQVLPMIREECGQSLQNLFETQLKYFDHFQSRKGKEDEKKQKKTSVRPFCHNLRNLVENICIRWVIDNGVESL